MIPSSPSTIYIDLDDVLCDTAGMYLQIVAREFNKIFTHNDIHSFNLQHSFGLDDAQTKRMFTLAHSPPVTLAMQPFDKAAATIAAWRNAGHDLAIVTGRHTSARDESLQWLERHRFCHDAFIMVDKYGWPDTDKEIAIPLEELSTMHFDMAIEDNTDMAYHLSLNMQTPVFLFDRPWNRALQYPGIRRFYDWQTMSTNIVEMDC